MGEQDQVMALFTNGTQAALALEALKQTPWKLERVHSPFPDREIIKALELKKSRVGYFTCAGGIFGLFFGFALSIFTATRWNLIVSGKPVIALIPFLIVGFECTILFSILGNMLGFLIQARLPDYKALKFHNLKCTGDSFGIVATCPDGDVDGLLSFFKRHGGESRLLEENQ